MRRATDDAASPVALTRRGAMKATAGLSAAALGLGAGTTAGSATGNIAEGEFQRLSVDGENRIVNEDGDPFVMRGVTIPDPKRLHRTRYLRGKTPEQLLDLVTSTDEGWYPRVVRVPARLTDIGEHPMGSTGPEYDHGELENPAAVADDRRKERPPQPPAFEREDLIDYFEEHYDPIVERCRERGVYCIVDFHRHWHEQPPGEEQPTYAENHLAYGSEYTNYWAYNTYDDGEYSFGEDAPASWGWVDRRFFQGVEEGHADWDYVETEADLEGTPYEYEHWQVNEALRDEAITFWEEAGKRYGDMEHVIFEPYHEPAAPGILGPVEGCGAVKQRPLWNTYLDEFMGPILEEIRRHYDGLVLVGVPDRCRSVQALHWRDFGDAGYEDIAVTWHNEPGQDVSQLNNWSNDTEYESPDAVAEDTGGTLEDTNRPPPDDVENEDCWGWEPYESGGLQNAMDHHPIAVTEFGWEDYQELEHWITPGGPTYETTHTYGEPIFEVLEADPRISWVASFADVRWMPRTFEYPDGPAEGDLDLLDDSFYEPDFEDLPRACEELPCEWELLDNPDSGQYLKDRLAEYADDAVPFETSPTVSGECVDVGGDDPSVDGQTVCDVNDDDLYRDVTGDGSVGQGDVAEFFGKQHREAWKRPELFDFSGNGEVTHGDVVELSDHVALD